MTHPHLTNDTHTQTNKQTNTHTHTHTHGQPQRGLFEKAPFVFTPNLVAGTMREHCDENACEFQGPCSLLVEFGRGNSRKAS